MQTQEVFIKIYEPTWKSFLQPLAKTFAARAARIRDHKTFVCRAILIIISTAELPSNISMLFSYFHSTVAGCQAEISAA